uniref:Fibronectin type-III domain-containing protein n=1 Tax=Gouania willdenowi TaxID=441366 RepID=A0A8C5N631_GOUWI
MTLEILLMSLWMQVHCNDVSHLSKEDVLLLKHEPNPRCFTRTEEDFTCFFETADNNTYDLLYTFQRWKKRPQCEMSAQETEEGTFLHVCVFPDSHVLLFVDLLLEVVERRTNSTTYTRKVSVEDNGEFLLDAPFNVSVQPTGEVGQLDVSWSIKLSKYMRRKNTVHRIRYSSRTLGEKIKYTLMFQAKGHVLGSLVPGEEVEVQVCVKSSSDVGHWSSWSRSVQAVAPQSADDVSLKCFTSDLHHICCFWNGSRYGAEIHYKLSYRMIGSWTEWNQCLFEGNFTDLCCFHGDESRKVRGKLISISGPITRLFYIKEFTLNHSIKTSAPGHVRGVMEKNKLCLEWEAPLPSLLPHLQYEVDHQTTRGEGWKLIKLQGAETETCVEVPSGSQYSVKVRAKPTGSIYSGHWSDWSDVLTGDSPTEVGLWLVLCIPVLMLTMASVLLCFFSSYLRKLKLYFWPPVPNLDKVLQNFLMEISQQTWDPPVTAKQCLEETMSSVVEVMTRDECPGLGKPSVEISELLSAEERSSCSTGVTVAPDYVSLSKENVRNSYIYEQLHREGEDSSGDDLHCSSTDGSENVSRCLNTDFLNQSYLPLAECVNTFTSKARAERGPGNCYTAKGHVRYID